MLTDEIINKNKYSCENTLNSMTLHISFLGFGLFSAIFRFKQLTPVGAIRTIINVITNCYWSRV